MFKRLGCWTLCSLDSATDSLGEAFLELNAIWLTLARDLFRFFLWTFLEALDYSLSFSPCSIKISFYYLPRLEALDCEPCFSSSSSSFSSISYFSMFCSFMSFFLRFRMTRRSLMIKTTRQIGRTTIAIYMIVSKPKNQPRKPLSSPFPLLSVSPPSTFLKGQT